jgi:hypothetical protein
LSPPKVPPLNTMLRLHFCPLKCLTLGVLSDMSFRRDKLHSNHSTC